MQRLNIPLSRHSRTTRHNRRVVWILVIFGLIALAVVWRGSATLLSRATIFSTAPDGTVAAVYLQINDETGPYIDTLLQSVPLISNRSIELKDIVEETRGDVAIFLTENGQRSLAIRSNTEALESLSLEGIGVTIQQHGPFLLLSETLVSISGIDISLSKPFFPSFSKTWVGGVWVQGYGQGDIRVNNQGVEVAFETEKQQTSETVLMNDMIAHALLNNQNINTPPLSYEEIFPYFGQIEEVIIRENGILISLEQGTLDENDLTSQLQEITALNNPSTLTKIMIDGSSYDELQIDPTLITVEEISIGGVRVFRSGTLLGLLQDGRAIISTSQQLVEAFVKPEESEANLCTNASIVVRPQSLLESISSVHYDPRLTPLAFIDRFSVIYLEKNKYSNVIHLSSHDCG